MEFKMRSLETYKWERTYADLSPLIGQRGVYSHYDNYSFSIIPSNKMAYFQVTFKPTLKIFNRTTLLFEGYLELSYSFQIGLLKEIKESVVAASKWAHEEFISYFQQHENLTELSTFEPQFHEHLMKEHVDLHLLASSFGNP